MAKKLAQKQLMQEYFNKGYLGLASQGFRRSRHHNTSAGTLTCAYRGEDGMKCFIGHCIDDADYVPYIEGASVASTSVLRLVDKDHVLTTKSINFLRICQNIHDRSENPDAMRNDLAEWALKHQLTIPSIPEAAA